ncbi:MAG: helix-turn-helix transcriptional regulator [Daejeonella sp.]
MEKFNLGEALLKYRVANDLSQDEMGGLLYVSRQTYNRMEHNLREPSYEEFKRIMNLPGITGMENFVPPLPPKPRKWYYRWWRWVVPIVIPLGFLTLMTETVGFRAVYPAELLKAHYPYKAIFIITSACCAICWWIWPPHWPFKKLKLFNRPKKH